MMYSIQSLRMVTCTGMCYRKINIKTVSKPVSMKIPRQIQGLGKCHHKGNLVKRLNLKSSGPHVKEMGF